MNRHDIVTNEVNDILESGWFHDMISRTCKNPTVRKALLNATEERMLESCMTIHHWVTKDDDDHGEIDFAMA